MGRKNKHRTKTCVCLDRDVQTELDKRARGNRSDYLNKLLRLLFSLGEDRIPEVEVMPATIKERNLAETMRVIEESGFIQALYLIGVIEVTCGVTPKKAREYIRLLEFTGKVVIKNGYVFSQEYHKKYKGLLPGTSEYIRKRVADDLKKFLTRFESKHKPKQTATREEEAILQAQPMKSVPKDCLHSGITVPCRHCGVILCTDCSSVWVQEQGTIIASCEECDKQ